MSLHRMTPEIGDPITPISPGRTVLEGEPTMWTWLEHQSEDKTVIEGTFRCTPGAPARRIQLL